MALPIDIESLLNKNRVESNRIEFKQGWYPIAVYHSVCAFANDLDNNGGGIPTIQNELRRNGSGRARLRTDECRTFFLIDIPCHPDFVEQEVNRVEDKMNLQMIREVMLRIMSQLVPSLYQVDSYIEPSDNQYLNKFLANIRTKSENECLKAMESWADIRILDKVVKVINTLYIETSLKDLQGISNIANRTRFKKQIIDPMIFLGIVEMTVPDKPNSRYQLYRLSKIGKELFTLTSSLM